MSFGPAFLVLLGAVCASANVTVSKCCKLDETLSEDKCVRTDNRDWKLHVFDPLVQQVVFFNSTPPNWHLQENVRPPCLRPALLPSHTFYIPFLNGSMYYPEFDAVVGPQDYCLDYKAVLICRKDRLQAITSVLVKKCCGQHGIFSSTNSSCITFKDPSYKIDIGTGKTWTNGYPHCNHEQLVISGKLHEAEMQNNGSLLMRATKTLLPAGNYCLEHVLENAGRSASIMTCQEHIPVVRVQQAHTNDLRFTVYPIALALSAVFLAATLAASAILPASHHVLHWRCQMHHVISLLVGNVLLCITQLVGKMNPIPCSLMAISMHFLFLAAFFWLNTMCFNIWWTFRDLRPQSVEKSQERWRLRLYELYAWGVPLVISGSAAILDNVPENTDFLKPKFGKNSCWFYGDMEIFTFFYGPIGILLIINLALFGLTARELTCGLWKRELVKSTSERAALGRVCLKLVVVMGVSWIAEVVSWLAGGPQEMWYVTDLINCLQGVFIFIVIGCQPQVLSAVKKLWCFRKHRENGTAGTTNHHSSSSQGLPSMGDTVTNHSVTNNTKSIPLETSC